ncbi:MAG: NlpC/P60 family protein [Pseudomonadota bacterium]
MTRSEIVSAAGEWIGTPYRHQASRKAVGADCLGLVRGVWRTCVGPEPEMPSPYTADWAEKTGDDLLLQAARRHLVERIVEQADQGDVLVFRMSTGVPAKHCAILIEGTVHGGRILHAYWGRSVCVTRLVPWWTRRIAGAFSFPNLED